MPQPWIISTPSVSQYQRMSDGGGDEPPHVTRESRDRSYLPGFASYTDFTPCQMVGTPADTVTSSSAMSWMSRAGSMYLNGMTCLQPSMVADHGSPQPCA